MNSRQYRRLAHVARKLSLHFPGREETREPKTKPGKGAPKLEQSQWSTLKKVGTLVGLLATLAGLIQVRPKVSVEPYDSLDLSSPFSQLFSVENGSYYALYSVAPRCVVVDASYGAFKFHHNTVSSRDIVDLRSGAKTTAMCRWAVKHNRVSQYTALTIRIEVPYRFFGIGACSGFDFSGAKRKDNTYAWTYRGISDCAP